MDREKHDGKWVAVQVGNALAWNDIDPRVRETIKTLQADAAELASALEELRDLLSGEF